MRSSPSQPLFADRYCVQTPGDPLFPYVGKSIAKLTLAQVKTLDCGSKRLPNFRASFPLFHGPCPDDHQKNKTNQNNSPSTHLPGIQDLHPQRNIRFRALRRQETSSEMEHRVQSQPYRPNLDSLPRRLCKGTRSSVREERVCIVKDHRACLYSFNLCLLSLRRVDQRVLTLHYMQYQSFDWRTLIAMKKINRAVPTSALIDAETVSDVDPTTGLSPWFAGLNLTSFPGATLGQKISQAAKSIGSDTLSPNAGALTPAPGLFTTKEMVDEAHKLGLGVVPWTVSFLFFRAFG
jgi:hypothetical protein